MESNIKVPVSPDEVAASIFAAVSESPMLRVFLGQALTEDLTVKTLRHLFGVSYAKD